MADVCIEVQRNRYLKDYETAIENIWGADMQIVPKGCSGVLYNSPEAASDCFMMTRNAYSKVLLAPLRIFKMSFGNGTTRQDVDEYINIMKNLYGARYQLLTGLSEKDGSFTLYFIVNSVSYVDGQLFGDNNASIRQLISALREKGQCELTVGENVFFDNNELGAAYR